MNILFNERVYTIVLKSFEKLIQAYLAYLQNIISLTERNYEKKRSGKFHSIVIDCELLFILLFLQIAKFIDFLLITLSFNVHKY